MFVQESTHTWLRCKAEGKLQEYLLAVVRLSRANLSLHMFCIVDRMTCTTVKLTVLFSQGRDDDGQDSCKAGEGDILIAVEIAKLQRPVGPTASLEVTPSCGLDDPECD